VTKIKCPNCGHAGPFRVWIDTQYDLEANGDIAMAWTPSWTRKDRCECPECNHEGVIGEFEAEPA
jgi:hypothetical protein